MLPGTSFFPSAVSRFDVPCSPPALVAADVRQASATSPTMVDVRVRAAPLSLAPSGIGLTQFPARRHLAFGVMEIDVPEDRQLIDLETSDLPSIQAIAGHERTFGGARGARVPKHPRRCGRIESWG